MLSFVQIKELRKLNNVSDYLWPFFWIATFPPEMKWGVRIFGVVLGWISDLPIGCQLTSSLSYEDQSWAADNWSTRNSDSYGRFVTIAFSWSNICRICKSQSYVTRHVNPNIPFLPSSSSIWNFFPFCNLPLGHNVLKLLKMSHLNFWILVFSIIF